MPNKKKTETLFLSFFYSGVIETLFKLVFNSITRFF
jgi:hypothetical protein